MTGTGKGGKRERKRKRKDLVNYSPGSCYVREVTKDTGSVKENLNNARTVVGGLEDERRRERKEEEVPDRFERSRS